MKKQGMVVVAMMLAVALASAEWYQVGGGGREAKVAVTEQSALGTTFEVNIPGIEVAAIDADGRAFSRLSIPGASTALLDVGKPEVPVVPVLLAVPTGTQVSLEVLDIETKSVPLGTVYPLQPRVPISLPPAPFEQDADFYLRDALYPSEQSAVTPGATWGNLAVVNVQVYPVRVNPAQQSAEVVTRLRVRVNYTGGSYPSRVSGWLWSGYRRTVNNFHAAGFVPSRDDPDATKLLVFSHDRFDHSDGLAQLLAWSEQRGYRTQMVVGEAFTPEAIKNTILEVYGPGPEHHLRWVLLVGDHDEIPLCPRVLGDVTILGDYYYSDLTPGYPDSLDWYPDIGVARLSPENVSDLDRQAAKILGYERSPAAAPEWFGKMTLVGGVGHGGIAMDRMRQIDTMLMRYYDWARDTLMGSSNSNEELSAAVNTGAGAMLYFGHGSTEYWAWHGAPPHWGNLEIQGLGNGDMTPVVYQMACNCGQLQSDPCVSEQWLSKYPGGAVASLAYTDVARGYGYNVEGFARALGDDTVFLGGNGLEYGAPAFDIGALSIFTVAWETKWSPCHENALAHLFLGDPAMPVWVGGAPDEPEVRLPQMIPPDAAFTVCCTVRVGARPVEGAQVCAWRKGWDGFYVTGRTDAEGIARLDVANTGPVCGEVLVTVAEGHAEHSTPSVPHTPILPTERTVPVGYGAWAEVREFPQGNANKAVKRGGWLAYNEDDGLIYAAKGNKTREFYVYYPQQNAWDPLKEIPDGPSGKQPDKGCRGICDGDSFVYMTKGNNTLGFWRYKISADSWFQLADVPHGLSGKKVKGGTDLEFVTIGDTGFVYMLKGYKTDFFRFNTVSLTWDSTLPPAPTGIKYKWDKGSWIVYDGDATIYAHKAKYYDRATYKHEFWKYDIPGDTWYTTPLAGMPLYGLHSGRIKKKKAKDGGAGAYWNSSILALKGGNTQQFWMYDVADDTWTEQDTVPTNGSTNRKKRVKYGADIVNANGVLYALKGNKTREFWRYIPGGGGFFGGGYAARPARARRRTGRRAGLTPFTIPGRPRPGLRSALNAGQSVSLPGLVRAPGLDQPKRPGEGPRTDVDTVFDVLTEFAPAWSPDGQWLAYSRYDPEFGWDRLFRFNPWTGEEIPIDQPDADCSRPAWSPSGEWVAYEVDCFGTGFTQVWRSRVTGTVSEVAPMTCQPFDHFNVRFSPDSKFLVYEADLPDFSQIHMVPFEAPFMELPITREPRDHFNPRPYWSTVSTVPPGRGEIEPGPATSWDVVYEREDDYFTQICWTPDGATAPYRTTVEEYQLTFREVDHTNPCPPNCSTDVVFQAEDDEFGMEQIWKVRLWEPGAEELLVLDEDADFGHPDVSPDGGMVACDRDLYDGSIVIYGIDLYGRMTGELTEADAIRTWPKFSPGGEAIAVSWELMAGEGGGVLSAGTVPGQDYRFRQVTANPAVGNIGVRWHMPYSGHVRIAVYDKVGRLVKLMRDEEASAGSGHAVWDRTDRYGRRVATGVYFCDFRAGEYRSRKKFVLMK